MRKENCRQEKCRDCGRWWVVSIMAKIPYYGYRCPACCGKQKKRSDWECVIYADRVHVLQDVRIIRIMVKASTYTSAVSVTREFTMVISWHLSAVSVTVKNVWIILMFAHGLNCAIVIWKRQNERRYKMNKTQQNICSNILKHYGISPQLDMLMEESAELIKGISKNPCTNEEKYGIIYT